MFFLGCGGNVAVFLGSGLRADGENRSVIESQAVALKIVALSRVCSPG